jgi:2-C-methyl-D-erythritol 4-phosphate cytidylyltransferase
MPEGVGPVWTIVVAGGSGRRFGGMKQFEMLDHRRVIDVSVEVATACSHGVVVVVPADDAERERAVPGGSTRSESVRAGLSAVPDDARMILVHDAARPFASPELYRRVVEALAAGADAAIPGVAVTDTVKVLADPPVAGAETLGTVVDTPDRARLVAVQTPQGFTAAALRAAHEAGGDATDDAALVEAAGGRVVVVAGDVVNAKITDPDDLERARRHVSDRSDEVGP